ncbi:MAG: FAD-dependent oxidoreductase [Candidatus Muirbacterium halophilum]|nr:FAD-dependent oxidoreductase [Candidatus Muirbacterium halophilum]MCK9477367.1 FAD-dependent oxidoreductase [Candidatus Muirbacterium halophilum]
MKRDIVIIGGGPAGMITAVTARGSYPDKKVTFIRREDKVLVPCGIPYIFHTLGSVQKNIAPDKPFIDNNIEIIVDTVINVDTKNKTLKLNSNEEIEYEKLVFATGSEPYMPTWLKGHELENVFVIKKNHEYLEEVKKKTDAMQKIMVVGAGFIGVEVAEELNKNGKEIYLVEKMDSIIGKAFDSEFVDDIHQSLVASGMNIITGKGVQEINGNGKVSSVTLEDGQKIEIDAVVLAMGYRPNIELAEKTGLFIGKNKNIWVDEYMRTSERDVFAVGDCAERMHFITRRPSNTMLASTATSEARVAGSNLYSLSTLKSFNGTIAIFSTKVGDILIGSAGITVSEAKDEGMHIVDATFAGSDRHPANLPGAGTQKVKLITSKNTGVIIGAQILGGESSSELINVLGYIIQNRMRVDEVFVSQIGTHPLTTAAPTTYPIVKAAEMILKKMKCPKFED